MRAMSYEDDQPTSSTSPPKFTIVSEQISHQRYLTVYNRTVKFPPHASRSSEGDVLEFDVIGHPQSAFQYAVTFPFHSSPSGRWHDGEVTLIREYCQGPHAMYYSLPTGSFDPKKHSDLKACAQAELSEEAHLKDGEMRPLLAPGVAVPEVKWCRNSFTPFIVVDAVPDPNPGLREVEEWIEVMRVNVKELKAIMRSGKMLLPSVTTCWWALEWLSEQQDKIDNT
jgi:8-oxo-dGTP pyrophosphatase MutT (NUDIX family)